MAFHVACPITCKRICFCKLGFPLKLQTEKAREAFFEDVLKLSKFLEDPWGFRVRERETVQVSVPKVAPPPVIVPPLVGDGGGGGVGGSVGGGGREGDEAIALSAQTKRVAMQKKAAVASIMAEDYARRFESGDLVAQDSSRDLAGEEPGQSNVNVMCRMCFHGEIEGSERARKMLSCKSCGKKYHRSCLKNWAQHRDLFHWSSWTCPSCRICEVCRRTGDPNKFMFCRRCDGAYHCYCQQPPHKNVSAGPYLCSKHTRCHSCGSKVPGNGLSVRWFLGYTCCDACGRLFVKGNYCPVCLKVYRDSESTPMVCCDVCQRWVHCQCDGISDEKYMQFQVDGNLQYKCATCRGECYQVKDLEDAVRELWRRRDEADRDLIMSLRAAAGLPTQEEIFSISPYSDDEDGPIVIKSEYGRSLKFSFKGSVDKSPKKTKKSSSKKQVKKGYQTSLISKTESHQSFENFDDARSIGLTLGNDDNDMQSHKIERPDMFSSPVAETISHTEGICSINQPGVLKHKFVDEVSISNEDRNPSAVHIKSSKRHGIDTGEDTGKNASKSTTVKGTKLVIHLGVRNKNVTNSPRSDASSCQREQELTTSNGSEDTSQRRTSDKYMVDKHDSIAKFDDGKGDKVDHSSQLRSSKHREREGNMIKLGKFSSDISNLSTKRGRGDTGDGYESIPGESMRVVLGKRNSEGSTTTIGPTKDFPASRGAKVSLRKHPEVRPDLSSEGKDGSSQMPSVSQSLPKDSKPLLKLKFKNPYLENQSSWVPQGEEEKNSVKGQRSKRKRPSPFMEKMTFKGDEGLSQVEQDNSMDEIMDASWILKTLGKDAIGKRVEVHQPSDNSWHKGMVVAVLEGKSVLSVDLDDGRSKTVELGKQGIRFVPQKQKRSRT